MLKFFVVGINLIFQTLVIAKELFKIVNDSVQKIINFILAVAAKTFFELVIVNIHWRKQIHRLQNSFGIKIFSRSGSCARPATILLLRLIFFLLCATPNLLPKANLPLPTLQR